MVVVFDWDGTLHDSGRAVEISWLKTAQEFGLKKDKEDIMQGLGGTTHEMATKLGFKEDERAEVVKKAVDEFIKISMEQNLLFKGVPEVLDILSSDYELALYSNGHLRVINNLLDKYGLRNYFDMIITSETAIKPDPKGIKLILDYVGKDSGVMIDDDPVGVEAANRAGIKSVGAMYGMNPKKLLSSRPHAVVDSVMEIPEVVKKLI